MPTEGPILRLITNPAEYVNQIAGEAAQAWAALTGYEQSLVNGIESTQDFVLNLFAHAWGVGFDFIDSIVSGAIDYISRVLGLPTIEQIQQVAAGVAELQRHTNQALGSLFSQVAALWNDDGQVLGAAYQAIAVDHNVIVNGVNDVADSLRHYVDNKVGTIGLDTGYVFTELSNLFERVWKLEQGVNLIPDPSVLNDLQAQIDDLRLVALPGMAAGILEQTGAMIGERLAPLEQAIQDNAECCAAGQQWQRDQQPNLDKLKSLLDALGVGLGVFSAAELLQLVTDFLGGDGGSIAELLGGWLTGDVDPVDIVSSVF